MADKYDDYDWDELPKEVQKAAAILGYTKEIWDKDKDPESFESDWDELTPEEQNAAAVLGYNQLTWDEDD